MRLDRCTHCGSRELPEALVDCADLAPLAGLCCADCERALLADVRDELPSERELLRREAQACGGQRADVAVLFGAGWVEDEQ